MFPTSTLGLPEGKPPLRDQELASLPRDSGLRDVSTPGLRDLPAPGLRDLSTPLSRGVPGLPSLREGVPDQEVYSSRTSLAGYFNYYII